MKKHLITLAVTIAFSSAVFADTGVMPLRHGNPVSATAGGDIQAITYSALKELAERGGLTIGRRYRIIDFRTRHTILLTKDINTGPVEVLVATALTEKALAPMVCSEAYPQDLIIYELENSSPDAAFDRGRITYRLDTRKNISSYEDWRAVKYRRGRNPATGKFTELTDYSSGYLDRFPFNNSRDPGSFRNVHVGRSAGGFLPDVVIGTGASTFTSDVLIGQGSTRITIGDNSDTIEISQVNGTIVIGDNCTHIRVGVCSDFLTIGDRCSFLTIGNNSSWITVRDNTSNCTFGDNISGMIVGDKSGLAELYVGNGVSIDPPPVIRASGTLERHLSTIPATIDITGVTHVDLANYVYAGIITLSSKNPVESVRSILKKSHSNGNDFPIEFRPAAGLTLAIVGTSPAAVNADGQIVMKGSLLLHGDKGDSITLKRIAVGNFAVFVESARSVY